MGQLGGQKGQEKGEWDSLTYFKPPPWMRLCLIQTVKLFLITGLTGWNFSSINFGHLTKFKLKYKNKLSFNFACDDRSSISMNFFSGWWDRGYWRSLSRWIQYGGFAPLQTWPLRWISDGKHFYLDNIGLVIFLVLAATVLTLILTLVKENLTQQMVSFRKLLWKERETLNFQLIVFGLKDGLT